MTLNRRYGRRTPERRATYIYHPPPHTSPLQNSLSESIESHDLDIDTCVDAYGGAGVVVDETRVLDSDELCWSCGLAFVVLCGVCGWWCVRAYRGVDA